MKVSFLDQKLGALLDADVNEEEPNILTAWVSPLIVTPKQDGDIQVCVDISRANEAILCEQHHIPTIKEIFARSLWFHSLQQLRSQFLVIRKNPSLVSVPISNHG